QKDLAADQAERAATMRKQLNDWLKQSGAKFPALDPRYTKEGFEKKIRNLSGPQMQRLEKQHAAYLDPEWEPKGQEPWWGSAPD
ncbi:MAG: sulfatase, partial [Verrucomicrobiota bacterium]